MLADGKGKEHVRQFFFGRSAFRDSFDLAIKNRVVRALHEYASRDRTHRNPLLRGIGHRAGQEYADIGLCGENAEGVFLRIGRDDDLKKYLHQFGGEHRRQF